MVRIVVSLVNYCCVSSLMTDVSPNTIAFHRNQARSVLAKLPLRKWPDITRFRSRISIITRIHALVRQENEMSRSPLTPNKKFTDRYRRLRIEMTLLATKSVLAYPGINDAPIHDASSMLLGASIKMDDAFYERGRTPGDRAEAKKAHLIKVLTVSYVEISSLLRCKDHTLM